MPTARDCLLLRLFAGLALVAIASGFAFAAVPGVARHKAAFKAPIRSYIEVVGFINDGAPTFDELPFRRADNLVVAPGQNTIEAIDDSGKVLARSTFGLQHNAVADGGETDMVSFIALLPMDPRLDARVARLELRVQGQTHTYYRKGSLNKKPDIRVEDIGNGNVRFTFDARKWPDVELFYGPLGQGTGIRGFDCNLPMGPGENNESQLPPALSTVYLDVSNGVTSVQRIPYHIIGRKANHVNGCSLLPTPIPVPTPEATFIATPTPCPGGCTPTPYPRPSVIATGASLREQ